MRKDIKNKEYREVISDENAALSCEFESNHVSYAIQRCNEQLHRIETSKLTQKMLNKIERLKKLMSESSKIANDINETLYSQRKSVNHYYSNK